jgi:hypothetical protein
VICEEPKKIEKRGSKPVEPVRPAEKPDEPASKQEAPTVADKEPE